MCRRERQKIAFKVYQKRRRDLGCVAARAEPFGLQLFAFVYLVLSVVRFTLMISAAALCVNIKELEKKLIVICAVSVVLLANHQAIVHRVRQQRLDLHACRRKRSSDSISTSGSGGARGDGGRVVGSALITVLVRVTALVFAARLREQRAARVAARALGLIGAREK